MTFPSVHDTADLVTKRASGQ